ncbi:hypothetical protein ILUMI_04768 [Ignelater luminosus]|uniref:RanBP2-type domain-containing protein n=1 Tax=Ignelater luminosus TaxID=2038154 RepID=A0A8K0DC87_IGNLU|nr:hypothetical protein ILUMI_04768 [Ignelater luminosus]
MTFSIDSEMDGYYAQDRLQELWQQIGSLHLSYLEMEESPQKLEQRNKLEDCIREFLCLAPHSQKFIFRETADVLHRSASTKKDFSGYRAALGWNAIGMYAANLLNQPWRKEYKQIQLYSGFYKHQIDANLVGAEVIFEAMGYKHDGDGILTLDGPICPDRVISLSQDSLVAYVECQILKAIWEEVSTNFKVSWLEVLEFRETHLCSPKQSVQALNYRFHERQFQQHTRSYSQGTDPFATGARYSSSVHPSSTLSANHSFPPLHSHASIASIPIAPQCIYGTNGYYSNNYATYAPVAPQHIPYHVPLTYAQTVAKPLYHPTNYFPNGYTVPPPPPPYVCPTIPTGQLIEVDSHSSHHYDTVDGPSHSRTGRSRSSELYNIKNDLKSSSDKELNADTIDSWDYVYRNLESQGYSKDLGERGDVLSPPLDTRKPKSTVKEAKKIKSTALEEGIYNLSLNDKPKKDCEYERRNSDASKSYEHERKHSESGTAVKKQLAKQALNGYVKTNNTLPLPEKSSAIPNSNTKIDHLVNNRPSNSKTLDVRKPKQIQESDKSKPKDQDTKETLNGNTSKWGCGACTYLNDCTRDICEMCGKSKVKIQDIMEIGGPQCPRCTLVNPKDNKVCDACAGSLKDSPTYI